MEFYVFELQVQIRLNYFKRNDWGVVLNEQSNEIQVDG